MNIFPSDEKMVFILCDDFRNEGNGKLTLYGIYGENLQVLPPLTQEKVTLQTLAVYAAFTDGLGNYKMTAEISGPGNVVLMPRGAAQPVEKKSNGWMNIALKMAPFQGKLGDYVLKITLENGEGGKKEYKRTFTIEFPPKIIQH